IQMALDHHAENARIATGDLSRDVARDIDLPFVPLPAVGVRAVDHEPRGETRDGELAAGRLDASRIVIGRLSAAQDDVAILVAGGVHDRGMSALGDRQKVVRCRCGLYRVDGYLHVAVGAVLETDWT